MLNFGNPLALLLGSLALLVALLYFLRMRFRRQPAGSVFIWRLFIDKNEVRNKADLAPALQDEMVRMPGSPIMFKGDREVPYKIVRETMLEISKTRVMGVSLAATELKEKP